MLLLSYSVIIPAVEMNMRNFKFSPFDGISKLNTTYKVAFAFLVAHFSHHVITAITSPLLPMIRGDLHLSYTQSGIVLSAFTLSYGIAQLPVGWLLQRVKPYLFVFMGIAGVGVSGILIGVSKGFLLLVIFQLLMGIMGSGYHPTAIFFISQVIEKDKKGKALGIHTIGGSMSYFIAPVVAAFLASYIGWRGTFVVMGIPVVVLGVVISLMVKNYTRRVNDKSEGYSVQEKEECGDKVEWFRLGIVMTLSVLLGGIMGSVIGFIPLYGVDIMGVNEKMAATFVSAIFISGLWASPLAGFLSDRVGELPLLIFAGFIGGPVIFALTLLKFGVVVYVLMIFVGMTIFIRMPVSESFIIGELHEGIRGTVLGIYFFASSLGGGLVTPLMGSLIDRVGFKDTFRITGGFLFIAVMLCVILLGVDRRLRTRKV